MTTRQGLWLVALVLLAAAVFVLAAGYAEAGLVRVR